MMIKMNYLLQKLRVAVPLLLIIAGFSGVILGQKVFKDVTIRTSDGATLATDVYLPAGKGPFPIILMRTPYGKESRGRHAHIFNARGYAYVVQDVRGKFNSSGVFRAWIDERLDGLETLDWISEQEWSNGKIGFLGSSYSGYLAMQLAASGHPSLKAIVNNSGPMNMYTVVFPGGAFHNTSLLPWTIGFTNNKTVNRPPYEGGLGFEELVEMLPLDSAIESVNYEGLFWNYVLNHQVLDDYWEVINMHNPEKVDIPVLHITGWYDFIATSHLDGYFQITNGQRARQKKINQILIVGPWVHDALKNGISVVGDIDFGDIVQVGAVAHYNDAMDFFDPYLKDNATNPRQFPPVRIFEVGSNQWFDFEKWPDTETRSWYLTSKKGANSIAGDGQLVLKSSETHAEDTFTFDPDNPVPTKGGANFHFPVFNDQLGIRDQNEVEKRKDVLVYTSAPLSEELRILGKIKANLYVSTTSKDADFTAKIVEVKPDGSANIMQEGIKRLSTAKSYKIPSTYNENDVVQITIDMGYLSHRLSLGSKIRVEISGSNFPKYSLNPGTGENPLTTKKFLRRAQSIHMSPVYPSSIELPVIEKSGQ